MHSAKAVTDSTASLYQKTLREIADAEAVPNNEEDMAHARALLDRLTPTELLQATFLLEDFVEETPSFRNQLAVQLNELGGGDRISMEDLLNEMGFVQNEKGEIESRRSEAA